MKDRLESKTVLRLPLSMDVKDWRKDLKHQTEDERQPETRTGGDGPKSALRYLYSCPSIALPCG